MKRVGPKALEPATMPPTPTPAAQTTWILVSGKYSPQLGGVADYCYGLANALAARGDSVHVLAPEAVGDELPHAGEVYIHRLPRGFGPMGLPQVAAEVRAIRCAYPEATLLVQYVPHAFGRRGANAAFAAWVAAQRNVWVVFHEVAFSGGRGRPKSERILAVVQRRMAKWMANRASRVFVTIPAWSDLLRSCGVTRSVEWLPVPSNIPTDIPRAQFDRVRESLGRPKHLVGHFGTYGRLITQHLETSLCELLSRRKDTCVLLVGRGSHAYLEGFATRHPSLAHRIVATGGLEPEDVAAHLGACDLLMQPYPDGVTCRRGTAMAGLALGKAVVSNLGWLSEDLWANADTVCLAPSPGQVARAADVLLDDPDTRERLGRTAQKVYTSRFSMDSLVARLTDAHSSSTR